MSNDISENSLGDPIDLSPLYFADIRFVRNTLCGKTDNEGAIKGLCELLDWVIVDLETAVAIAQASGKKTILDGRLTVSAAIDRAEHLVHVKDLL